MTTVVMLLLGAGSVLIVSAVESNPDGSDVSVLKTISDVWNDQVNFQQGNTPAPSTGSGPMTLAQQRSIQYANYIQG